MKKRFFSPMGMALLPLFFMIAGASAHTDITPADAKAVMSTIMVPESIILLI